MSANTVAIRSAVRNALTDCAAGDLILVAVSGGADSLALAHALSLEAPKLALRVEGVTVDHQLQSQSSVQAEKVVAALKKMDADPEVEVIIITRGGGGFLDLVGFSDEALVRAVAACETPVISAIGHENDRPIIDDVSDLRASTPTDAAKRVVPDVVEERKKIKDSLDRMKQIIGSYLGHQVTLIQQIRQHPLLKDPHAYLIQRTDDLARALGELRDDLDYKLDKQSTDLANKKNLLRSLSPQSTLDRGYAVVRDSEGNVITDPKMAKSGTLLKLRVAKGDLDATAN